MPRWKSSAALHRRPGRRMLKFADRKKRREIIETAGTIPDKPGGINRERSDVILESDELRRHSLKEHKDSSMAAGALRPLAAGDGGARSNVAAPAR